MEQFVLTKKAIFNAPKKSCYKVNLKYTAKTTAKSKNNRQRNIIWFNLAFNKSVKTYVAKIFFHLLDKHFLRTNRLYKIFNRNTVKVSYNCMKNVRQIIKIHNNYVSRKKPKLTLSYNCRKKDDFLMNGNCLKNNVIYKRTVSPTTTTTKQGAYLGLAEGEWKQRYYNHTQSLRNKSHKNDTSLSSYIWESKNKKSEIVPGCSNISKQCLLCLHQKLYLATYHDQKELLNKRSELPSKFCHK